MKKHLFLCALGLGLFVPACTPEEDEDFTDKPQPLALNFAALVGEKPFDCTSTFELGTSAQEVSFSDLKLYMYDVKLINADGSTVPVTLKDDGVWQSNGVAMLDFEDGTGGCANGTLPTNSKVEGTIPAADSARTFSGVQFMLGIPFDTNHADVGALPSPLNLPSMFWSWQGGRKFVRLDGKSGENGLRFHLGSTGCEGEGTDVMSCANENREQIKVMGGNPRNQTIALDIAAMYSQVDLTPVDEKSAICMSGPGSTACPGLFSSLGLSYEGSAKSDQTAFVFK